MRRTSLALAALILATPATGAAKRPEAKSFAIELTQGPVVGSVRVVGLGGAYVAVAEGTDGVLYNPAALANRYRYSRDYWDWDFSFDFLNLVGEDANTDFFNDGLSRREAEKTSFSKFTALILGLSFIIDDLGVGVIARGQQFEVGESATENPVRMSATEFKIGLATSLFDEELIIGATARGASLQMEDLADPAGEPVAVFSGGTVELGLLWKPAHLPLRVGVVGRGPVRSDRDATSGKEEDVERLLLDIDLPRPARMLVPSELSFGLAWAFGPLGPVFNEGRLIQTERAWGRWLLATSDLVITPAVEDPDGLRVIGLSAWVQRADLEPVSGATVSPRGGVEANVCPRRIRARAGTYWEPARYEGVDGRIHGTAGFDLRLFELFESMWRLSTVIDAADGYTNWALSLGFWH